MPFKNINYRFSKRVSVQKWRESNCNTISMFEN